MNLTDIYANGTAQQLWQAWSQKQRTHFLIDHADMFIEVMEKDFNTSAEEFAKMDFMKLPNSIRKEVIIHHAMGIYKEGGAIKNQYKGKTPEEVWNGWTKQQRAHFISDHEVLTPFRKQANDVIGSKWNQLPGDVEGVHIKGVIANHVDTGQYNDGGATNESVTTGKYMVKYVGKRWFVIYKFSDGEEMIMSDPLKTEKGAEAKKVRIMDMAGVKLKKGGIIASDIKKGARFKNKSGSVFIVDSIGKYDDGTPEVKASLDIPGKGGYSDPIDDFVDFLNEENAIKMNEGGTINKIKMIDPKLSPAKQKLVTKIDKIKKAMADIKSESIRKAMQKKINKLQAEVDYNPSVKQRVAQGTGRFFIDIPSTDKKKLYKALWAIGIKPKMHTLNGSTKVIFTNAGNMQKGYGIYAALLSNMGKPVPELDKIKGKL